MKNFLRIAALMTATLASQAYGYVTSMTIQNRTNVNIQCAFAQIQPPSQVTTFHWYSIANGRDFFFNQRVDGLYCESTNPAVPLNWPGTYPICVTRGATYTNPIFSAQDARVCNQIHGNMANFYSISGSGHLNFPLYP